MMDCFTLFGRHVSLRSICCEILLLALIFWTTLTFSPLAFSADPVIHSETDKNAQYLSVDLSPAEQRWLKAHKTIKVAVKDGWMPIEFKLESDRHQGLSVDYLRALSNVLNVEFEMVSYIDYISPDKADVISGVSNIHSLKDTEYRVLNKPFLVFPYAIYANRSLRKTSTLTNLHDLKNHRVAVFKNASIGKKIRESYPEINLVYVDIADEALEQLRLGNIDAYVGNEMIIDYHVSVHRLNYIEKTGLTEFSTEVLMAIRNDWPLFSSILEKGLDKIGPNNQEIVGKWKIINSEFNQAVKAIFAVIFVIFVLMLFGFYRLKKTLKKQSIESQEQIWQRANFDFLTALPNRHLFQNRLDKALSRTNRSRLSVGLLFIDLDNFKHVNDQSGHSFGDKLLLKAANRINGCVRSDDTVARFGGDEFVVLISDVKDNFALEAICQKILIELQKPFYIDDRVLLISASIGVAVYPDDSQYPEELLSFADKAMYEAKKLGRNQFHFFTEAIQAASIKRLSITNDLKNALVTEQFVLYYQPIINLKSSKITKAEVLIRWNHPIKGITSPIDFIPIAEETGLIKELGQWVFYQAIKELLLIHESVDPAFQLSINVSPQQFQNPESLLMWIKFLKKQNIPGHCISLEITEGLLLEATEPVTNTLSALRDYGVEISIDDFGTGYSALSYLKKFDIDYVKIDKSFVQSLEPSNYDAVLCEAIIQMAHKLGISVVAEGIETATQNELLSQFGCDYGQGFLFAEPDQLKRLIMILESDSISLKPAL